VHVRTTVTLDPDVAALLREEMEQRRLPFKQVLNQAIRRGLGFSSPSTRPAVRTRPHDFGFKPGIDLDRLNQFADELEADEFRCRVEPQR
jgi:hypothetical protein